MEARRATIATAFYFRRRHRLVLCNFQVTPAIIYFTSMIKAGSSQTLTMSL